MKGLVLLLAAGTLVAACANPPGNPVRPEVKTESECRASGNPARCVLENDLAGGPPIAIDGRR